MRSAGLAVAWLSAQLPWRQTAKAQYGASPGPWTIRRVMPGDEDSLVSLMRACVTDEDAFHGMCNAVEWTRGWAETVVSDRPRSIIVTRNDALVAYFDLPDKGPATSGVESIDRHQRAFWCGAAGIRMDLIGEGEVVPLFQHLLFEAFSDAKDLGYEFVRAAAPWEQHPYLPEPFASYPGLTIEPFEDEKGISRFLIEWRLDDALVALTARGATEPHAS
jgi:hypothetical protein